MKSNALSLSELFGVDEEDVVHVDTVIPDKGICFIYAYLKAKCPACPRCGEPNPHRFGPATITVNNSVVVGLKTTYVARIQRYRCRKCHAVYKDSYSLYGKGRKISRVLESSVISQLSVSQTYTSIARLLGISVTEVINIMDSLPRQPKLTLPRVMCVDEFHFTKGRKKDILGDYPFVISNPYDGTIIDIVGSRRIEALREYFRRIPEHERRNVRIFVSDMNETYRLIKREFFPWAIHVVDHFHVMKLFSEAMMAIRKRAMNAEKDADHDAEYRLLKGHWRLFQKDKSSLTKIAKVIKRTGEVYTTWDLVEECLGKYPDLGEMFDMKQEFWEFSKKRKKPGDAASWVPWFAQKLSHSLIPELQRIGKTFGNWLQEIINAYTPGEGGEYYSNAIAEANNNAIQTLMDAGYGYVNFERFRNRLLMINRSEEAVARRKAIREAKKRRLDEKEKAKG